MCRTKNNKTKNEVFSQTLMIYGRAGERGGYFFNSSLPLSPAS